MDAPTTFDGRPGPADTLGRAREAALINDRQEMFELQQIH